ncbi:hypothetical protein Tco_1035287 [Tanacetum coccineum]
MDVVLQTAANINRRVKLKIHDVIKKGWKNFLTPDFNLPDLGYVLEVEPRNVVPKKRQDASKVRRQQSLSNWEKSHFMVKEGIVLGHKISKKGIEVGKAKIDVIAKLPHPTTVKGVQSFLGHAGFYRRFIKDFSKISRSITHLLEKNTPFIFSNECIQAFETLKKKLIEAPILIAPD